MEMDEGDRLEKFGITYFVMDGGYYVRGEDAADRLSEQQQVIDELVAALTPFAEAARIIARDAFSDDFPVHAARGPDGDHLYQLKALHFFRTLEALSRAKEAGK